MTWRRCARCGRELVLGEDCACPLHEALLRWDADIRADFSRQPATKVGEVRLPDADKLGLLVWDLTWLSGQDPWENAAGEGEDAAASVAFFGRYEGRPFVLHDLRGRDPALYVVGAPDLPGQLVLDAVFAYLERRPWYGHAEPRLLM